VGDDVTGAALVRSDAVAIPLADESVDLIITSPPYFALRSYQDEGEHYEGQIGSEATPTAFLAALWAVTDECWRVLKPTGSLWVNLGDKYAGSGGPGTTTKLFQTAAIKRAEGMTRYTQAADVPAKSLMGLPWRYALGLTNPITYRTDLYDSATPQWTLRAEIIWSKPNGLPESVTDRVRRSHEQWFHLTKQGRYYAAVDEVREPHTDPRKGANGGARDLHTEQMSRKWNPSTNDYNPLGKLPGSVWTIASEPLAVPDNIGVDHFAAFPTEWPRRIILGWSPPGICVKCGEGRTPVISKRYKSIAQGYDSAGRWGLKGQDEDTPLPTRLGDGTEATITGYACRCDVPTAPTRPAIVLDPFAGTGTVPLVARTLDRYGIGLDLSRDYLRLATWRIHRSGHGAKAMARTNRERQGSLW
jgi:DNA modification methylase